MKKEQKNQKIIIINDNKIIIKGMIIDIRTNDCLYITINDHIYYIDDSTGEQIMDKWIDMDCMGDLMI
jgi:hypothetical protein